MHAPDTCVYLRIYIQLVNQLTFFTLFSHMDAIVIYGLNMMTFSTTILFIPLPWL